MNGIEGIGAVPVIPDRVAAGRPVLGICVGMQVLYERGDEHGRRTAGPWPAAGAGHPVARGRRAAHGLEHRSPARRLRAVRRGGAGSGSTSCTRTPLTRARGHRDEHGDAFAAAVERGPLCCHPVPSREVRRGRRATAAQLAGHPVILLPAVDVTNGQAVRLVHGEAGSETALRRPARSGPALAARRRRPGCTWSTWTPPSVADPTGTCWPTSSAASTSSVELSGGIRDDDSLDAALATGAARVNVGTAALEDPAWVREAISRVGDRIAVGLDVRGTTLAARGWTRGRRRALRRAGSSGRRGLQPLRRDRRPQGRHPHRSQPRPAAFGHLRHRPAGDRKRWRQQPRGPHRDRRGGRRRGRDRRKGLVRRGVHVARSPRGGPAPPS